MRGRKPKPTKLKIVEGNPGGRPLNKREPQPDVVNAPPPPDHLDDIAKEAWVRMSERLNKIGLLTELDLDLLGFYCECFSRQRQAEERVKNEGIIIETTNGNLIQNPAVGIANKAKEMAMKLATEFGMTPSCRSRLVGKDPKSPAEKWKFDNA